MAFQLLKNIFTGKSPKTGHEAHPRKETGSTRRQLTRCRSDPHLGKHAQTHTGMFNVGICRRANLYEIH